MRRSHTSDGLLFSGVSIFDILTQLKARVPQAVDNTVADALLSTSTEDMVEFVASHCALDVPTLLRDQAHVDEPTETTIRVNDFGRELQLPATSILLNVPFTGNKDCFDYQPSTYTLNPPHGTTAGNVLYIRVTGTDLTKETVDKEMLSGLHPVPKTPS